VWDRRACCQYNGDREKRLDRACQAGRARHWIKAKEPQASGDEAVMDELVPPTPPSNFASVLISFVRMITDKQTSESFPATTKKTRSDQERHMCELMIEELDAVSGGFIFGGAAGAGSSQLIMVNIQSLISARQAAVSSVAGMVQALGDATKSVANHIGS
jgi:predicted ATP-dependent serine protease